MISTTGYEWKHLLSLVSYFPQHQGWISGNVSCSWRDTDPDGSPLALVLTLWSSCVMWAVWQRQHDVSLICVEVCDGTIPTGKFKRTVRPHLALYVQISLFCDFSFQIVPNLTRICQFSLRLHSSPFFTIRTLLRRHNNNIYPQIWTVILWRNSLDLIK